MNTPFDLGTAHEVKAAGWAAMDRKDWSTALALFLEMARHPDPRVQSEAWNGAGLVYEELQQGDAAWAAYKQAGCLNPENAVVLGNIGVHALGAHNYGEAEAYFRKALRLSPHLPHVLNGMSALASRHDDHPEALRWAKAAIRHDPACGTAHWNISLASLALGDWATGWLEHEWRKKLPGVGRALRFPDTPQWQGDDIAGKTLLVLGEQGFGDCLMWTRMLQALPRQGIRVVFEVYDPLMPLYEGQHYLAGVCRRLGEFPPHDTWAFLADLPRLWQFDGANDPAEHPMIRLPRLVRTTTKPRLAFAWQGRQEHATNAMRSMKPEQAAAFIADTPYEWVQCTPGACLPGMTPHAVSDFRQMAMVMLSCDAVVSVDSAPLHLAGCLGLPALGLLPAIVEWRWRTGHPWYPSVSPVPQRTSGDWMAFRDTLAMFLTSTREQAA